MAVKKKTVEVKPFKAWLEEKGFKALEDFVHESRKRGYPVRMQTAEKWPRGVKPRKTTQDMLRRVFEDIRF